MAAQVLDWMFDRFPGSAKELPRDKGFAQGPKPGIFRDLSPRQLQELCKRIEGIFVICARPDEVSSTKEILGDYLNVLSIRDSKG